MDGIEGKRSGRELAVEALFDTHPNGPAYRVKKIKEEIPRKALKARPIELSKTMLMEMSNSLSKYENRGEYLDFTSNILSIPNRTETEKKDISNSPSSVDVIDSIEIDCIEEDSSKPINETVLENIHRYHAKTLQMKRDESLHANEAPKASPPTALISVLRRVFKPSIKESRCDSEQVQDSETEFLAKFLQYISAHQVFGSGKNNDDRNVNSSKLSHHCDFSNNSAIANVEAIVGNACVPDISSFNDLNGLFIAALSILTTCFMKDENESNDSDSSDSLELNMMIHDHDHLQVLAPLSLLLQDIEVSQIYNLDQLGDLVPRKSLTKSIIAVVNSYEECMKLDRSVVLSTDLISEEKEDDNAIEDGQSCASSDSGVSCAPLLIQRNQSDSSDDSSTHSVEDEANMRIIDQSNTTNEDVIQEAGSYLSQDREHSSSLDSSNNQEFAYQNYDDDVTSENNQKDVGVLTESFAPNSAGLTTEISDEHNHLNNTTSSPPNTLYNIETDRNENIITNIDTSIGETDTHDLPPVNCDDIAWLKSTFERCCPQFDSSLFDPDNVLIFQPSTLTMFGQIPTLNAFICLILKTVELLHDSKLFGSAMQSQVASISGTDDTKSGDDLPLSSSIHIAITLLCILSKTRSSLFEKILFMESDDDNYKDTEESEYNLDNPASPTYCDVAKRNEHSSIAEDLEEKGMIRKAAAAAELASLRQRERERKRIYLTETLKCASISSFLVLKALRKLFQCLSLTSCPSSGFVLSNTAKLIFSESLKSFTSPKCIDSFQEYSRTVSNDHHLENLFQSMSFIPLFHEASTLWAESVVLVISLPNELEELLLDSLQYVDKDNLSTSDIFSRTSRMDVSWTSEDENVLKMRVLFRRLLSSDALDFLVPKPIAKDENTENVSAFFPSLFLSRLGELVFKVVTNNGLNSDSVLDLYRALCHRVNLSCFQWGKGILEYDDNLLQQKKSNVGGEQRIFRAKDPELIFDQNKCADSIAIESQSSTNQRANKVWGAAISSKGIEPKSGVHEWAVKLNQCEKGHIFIGIATSRASTKTYVGGDKNGWGMIGTRALWHDRKKIRNDYGKTLRTGDTIVVRLDTNVGTLSYSRWKEHDQNNTTNDESNSSFSLDQEDYFQIGNLEDWGVAFEGLPVDTKLYPAIGMYQRDDKATLLSLRTCDTEGEKSSLQSSSIYYSQDSPRNDIRLEQNLLICHGGVSHANKVLSFFSSALSDRDDDLKSLFLEDIVPSIATNVACLPPCIPILSGKIAYNMLPILMEYRKLVEKEIRSPDKDQSPFLPLKNGEWCLQFKVGDESKKNKFSKTHTCKILIETKASSIFDGFEVSGSWTKPESVKSRIYGFWTGNCLKLQGEELTIDEDGDVNESILIEGISSPCGLKFEGSFQNVSKTKYGVVTASFDADGIILEKDIFPTCHQWHLVSCSYLLTLAINHLAFIMNQSTILDDIGDNEILQEEFVNLTTRLPFFRYGFRDNRKEASSFWDNLRETYSLEERLLDSTTIRRWYNHIDDDLKSYKIVQTIQLPAETFDMIDSDLVECTGGLGSLSSLDKSHNIARRSVVKAILYHSGYQNDLDKRDALHETFVSIWEAALVIVETGVRNNIIRYPNIKRAKSCRQYCNLVQEASSLLLELSPPESTMDIEAIVDFLKTFYNSISKGDDLSMLRKILKRRSQEASLSAIWLNSFSRSLKESISLSSLDVHIRNILPFGKIGNQCCEYLCWNGAAQPIQLYLSNLRDEVFSLTGKILDGKKTSSDSIQIRLSPIMQCLVLSTITCFIQVPNLSSYVPWGFISSYINRHIDLSMNKKDRPRNSTANCVDETTNCVDDIILNVMIQLIHCILYEISSKGTMKEPNVVTSLTRDIGIKALELLAEECAHSDEKLTLYEIHNDIISCCQKNESDLIDDHVLQGLSREANTEGNAFSLTLLGNEILTCLFAGVKLSTITDLVSTLFQTFFIDKPLSSSFSPYRQRLLKLMKLSLSKSKPKYNSIIQICTYLDRLQSSQLQEEFLYLELRQTISIIRYLLMFSDWKQIIDDFFQDKCQITHFLQFIGGIPGRLIPGSFVLIKPEGAIAQNMKSKNISGQAGRVLPVSTESIVGGLLRSKSKAGIISNFDKEESTCEIVLCERFEQLDHNICPNSDIKVRVVKAPISQLASVEEMDLFLDPSDTLRFLSTFDFHSHLTYTSEKMYGKDWNIKDQDSDLAANLLSFLRSSIVFFSIPELVREMKQNPVYQQCVSLLLEIASSTSQESKILSFFKAQCQSLSCLPDYEDRYWYLKGLISNLSIRKKYLDNIIRNKMFTKIITSEELNKTIAEESRHLSNGKMDTNSSTLNKKRDDDSLVNESVENIEEGNSSSNDDSDDEEDESDENERNFSRHSSDDEERSHLREVAVVQMLELGLPRAWAEYALNRVGGTNIEAAVHFCLERGAEMELLVAQDRERRNSSLSGGSQQNSVGLGHLLQQLVEMGFPSHWCAEALAQTGQNVDEALTWILTNGERLSALDEDQNDDEEEESYDSDSDSEDHAESDGIVPDTKLSFQEIGSSMQNSQFWTKSVLCPITSLCGRANIDSETMEVSGVPSGGFSSVGTKGILLREGKWYYECVLLTSGCIQIGWADSSFSGQADRGDGCGDGPSSWAFDGWRRYKWHCSATEWGCRWKDGDVIGCLVDMDTKEISFTLNGKAEEVGMGKAFSGDGFKPCGGVYPCVSFNRKEKIRFLLGGTDDQKFNYDPPGGYKPVGKAVLSLNQEFQNLLEKESIYSEDVFPTENKSYLCDLSNAEHGHEIFAWQHRYYGADASVHLGISRRNKKKTPFVDEIIAYSTKDRIDQTIERNLLKKWEEISRESISVARSERLGSALKELETLYSSLLVAAESEFEGINNALSVMYARKCLLHYLVSWSEDFDMSCFSNTDLSDEKIAKYFLNLLDVSCSLRDQGWVGEAGAMYMASEALGLSISTSERSSRFDSLSNILSGNLSDSGVSCVAPQNSQLLNSAKTLFDSQLMINGVSVSSFLSAGAEVAFCENGLATSAFLKDSILSALCSSEVLVEVAIAFIRRSLRILGNVQARADDQDDDDSGAKKYLPHNREPDAKFISLLTGAIISGPMTKKIFSRETSERIASELFEAWSVGLLSRSMPWRMVSSMTLSAILNSCHLDWDVKVPSIDSLTKVLRNLETTTVRRLWAERAAFPICSRYLQSLIDLNSSIKRITSLRELVSHSSDNDACAPKEITFKEEITEYEKNNIQNWEAREGWICGDNSWDIWKGTVEYFEVDWESPTESPVRSLMDSGKGPPLLSEGCVVMRGADWDENISKNEDGKDIYENLKKRRKFAKKEGENSVESDTKNGDDKAFCPDGETEGKIPHPKLPIGKVIGIEPWNGIPATARRVRWDLTGNEGLYRVGGDGGKFDIVHVEVNEKCTRVTKRYPNAETQEQCAVRHGFGNSRVFNILLRVRKTEMVRKSFDGEVEFSCPGVLEWPDFGAAVSVDCIFHSDGAVTIQENNLLFGAKEYGWEPRFGQPEYVSGTSIVLSKTNGFIDVCMRNGLSEEKALDNTDFEELLGSSSFIPLKLRNRANGEKIRVASEMRLVRSSSFDPSCSNNRSAPLPPMTFDSNWKSSSLRLSEDNTSLTCSSQGKSCAFMTSGFSKGLHYWEVQIVKADIGSVFIGVAEKSKIKSGSSKYSYEDKTKFNRWHGWGFVNFRATFNEGSERVYGSHYHSGDIIGVLLDCDSGRLSFFYDGVKYGEHILNDLGCAFENLSPFGFNADGCGSGGVGLNAPSGENGRSGGYPANGNIQAKTLFPVVGLSRPGDCAVIRRKWITNYGVDGYTIYRNALLFDEILQYYKSEEHTSMCRKISISSDDSFPDWVMKEAYSELKRWEEGRLKRVTTRAQGPIILPTSQLTVDIDTSVKSCIEACARLGLTFPLLPGDLVSMKKCELRNIDLSEEVEILGSFQGNLWYRIVSQKSEGGSLSEGGGRAWYWDESDLEDGSFVLRKKDHHDLEIPILRRFIYKRKGGLSFDRKTGMLVKIDIIDATNSLRTPEECASKWAQLYGKDVVIEKKQPWICDTFEDFKELIQLGLFPGMDQLRSDTTLVHIVTSITDKTKEGGALECSYEVLSQSLFKSLKLHNLLNNEDKNVSIPENTTCPHVPLTDLIYPPIKAIMARVALLRTINKRAEYAVPFYSMHTPQEDSSVLGGGAGFGAPLECCGKSRNMIQSKNWEHATSLGKRTRNCKGILFSSVKTNILKGIVLATTTPTSMSHDEYELPRDIRTIRINRLKAKAMKHENGAVNNCVKKEMTVFGQLQNELRGWSGSALRRSYIARGHGGQPRAFKVKLIGEGVNDYSGPYREVFTDAMRDVNNTVGELSLGILVASPNKEFDVGENRDLNMFARCEIDELLISSNQVGPRENELDEYYANYLVQRNDHMYDIEDSLCFLGKLAATAFRHNIPIELDLPLGTVWNAMCEDIVDTSKSLAEIDVLEYRRLMNIDTSTNQREKFISPLLVGQKIMLNSFVEGISSILPLEVFALFSGEELRNIFCGSDEVDVSLLQKIVEYEGYDEKNVTIQLFWETLHEMTTSERKLFLQFVWARSRMPMKEVDFDSPFKIQKDSKCSSGQSLPSASTCFFTLNLPPYEQKEILREKLLFAINNVTTMESDYVTNDVEVGEGWNGL